MDRYDLIVIGAGISGLSMAYYAARRGLTPLILERSSRVGGVLESHNFGPKRDQFWVEMGAHSCFNSYGNLLGILEELQFLEQLQPRQKVSFKLWVSDRLLSIPSRIHYLELLASLPRLLTTQKAGRSVAEYYGRVVGRRNLAEIFQPAFDAVLCQPAAGVPAELLFRSKPRRKDIMRSFTFAEGLQTIAKRIAAYEGLQVILDAGVNEIEQNAAGFAVQTESDQTYHAKHVCVATPVAEAARLLALVAPKVAAKLRAVELSQLESLGVMLESEAVPHGPLGGIIGVQTDFYSVVSRDTLPHPRYRGFTFHFRPRASDATQKLERICKVLGVRQDQLLGIANAQRVLPAPQLGHAALIQEVDQLLSGQPLALSGNYFLGISIEDCISRSRQEAMRLFSDE